MPNAVQMIKRDHKKVEGLFTKFEQQKKPEGKKRICEQVIQELEAAFRGAGWNVIKVIWGEDLDPLLARDTTGLLQKRMNEVVDGEYQTFVTKDGAYLRQHFYGKYPELLDLVAHLSDDELCQSGI